MNKVVRYNGKMLTDSEIPKVTFLTPGNRYVVVRTVKRDVPKYVLRGIDGEYKAEWFDDVNIKKIKPVHFLLSYKIPQVGKKLECVKIGYDGAEAFETATIYKVSEVALNVYKAESKEEVYIVKLA